jgi:2,4-dienoyl-CoA reductase-like NADH-dependent reductase (Old Yellow Enzyme family)
MYEKLFSPVRIGRAEIKNRVAMTPMGVNLAAAGGGVNDDIMAFYEARARGGVGLIISGLCRVMDGAGASEACQLPSRRREGASPQTQAGNGRAVSAWALLAGASVHGLDRRTSTSNKMVAGGM